MSAPRGGDPSLPVRLLLGMIRGDDAEIVRGDLEESYRIRLARTEPRFQAALFAGFAGIALLLAAVGLYGTLAHAVGRRTREMGIRMAVGADCRAIRTMVLREGMQVFAGGLGIGLVAAAVLTRLLRGLLFGVQPIDSLAFAATAALLTAVAGLAVYRPARSATRVDPMQSLRAD